MNKAFGKTILRSIAGGKKRFFSIMLITALGVTMLIGIYAACQDMYLSADHFYDDQNLFDIRILSTLGLTKDDVAALKQVPGVVKAEGAFSDTVHIMVNDAQKTVEMSVLSRECLNMPYLVSGALPVKEGEIAVTQKYLTDSGKSIGDSLTLEDGFKLAEDPVSFQPHKWETIGTTEEVPANKNDSKLDTTVDWNTQVDTNLEQTDIFRRATYTITGVIIDPMNTSNDDESKSFRATTNIDYYFYATPEDMDGDFYTSVYLTLSGLSGLSGYSNEYQTGVKAVLKEIETTLMKAREQARYADALNEGNKKLADAEKTMNAKFADANQQFTDAWQEIRDGKKELVDGKAELKDKEREARQQISDAWQTLADSKADLLDAEKQLASGKEELDSNSKKLNSAYKTLNEQRELAEQGFASAEAQFATSQTALDNSKNTLSPTIDGLKAVFGSNWPEAQWSALVNAAAAKTVSLIMANPAVDPDPAVVAAATADAQNALAGNIAALGDPALSGMTSSVIQAGLGLGVLNGSQQALDAQKSAYEAQKADAVQQLDQAQAQLDAGKIQLREGQIQISENEQKIADGWKQYYEGRSTLYQKEADANKEFADAWQTIDKNQQDLNDAETKIRANELEYLSQKLDARVKLANARQELKDIKLTQWYVQDRTALDSYSSMKNEMSSIESLGKLFPIIFLTVAILISLTTMTRMVDEERGLIGVYKALGLSDWAICQKYLLYALLASLLGSLLGNFFGFIVLPKYLMTILQSLYTIPYTELHFYPLYGIGSSALFVFGIVGATALACRAELRQMPATLLRPKAPRAGSRVLLERIPFIWNRLKFLDKVTARNLFRYTRRLIMTVAGIMGCTVLLVIGFTIHDTVTQMVPSQYDEIYRYQLMVVSDDNAKLIPYLDGQNAIQDYLNVQIENVKVINAQGDDETMQLIVVPDGADLENYIRTPNREGIITTLNNKGILLTQNAADLLKVTPGQKVTLQNADLEEHTVVVTDVVKNYLGNSVYLSQTQYEALFGQFEPNAALAHFSAQVNDAKTYTKDLQKQDFVMTAVSTEAMRKNFTQNFALLNAVVFLLILLAAGLAFLVLFTLSHTNISERVRELATIKVLGFFDNEVHAYVNKEMMILTTMGVLIGLPAGRMVSELVIAALKFPSVNFELVIQPVSYLFSAVIALGFAFFVSLMTNRTLDQIDMVEALKSVE